MENVLLASGWVLCGMWLIGVGLPLFVQWRRRLPRLAAAIAEPDTWPRVSVVVTAKDEGPQIADCLSSLLASDYPELELIAINDRSSDETGPAIDALAATDPRIQPLHITELPSDWLGKNHAMWRGAQAAQGSWILFTDGDIIYQPETIRVAVSFAIAHRLDHLTLAPSMLTGSYAESSLVSFFALIFAAATQSWLARLPTRHIYVGVGAFNLVKRTAYESAGGHLPLRYDVADDLRLGQLLKRHGCRADMLMAGSFLKVRWQESSWSTITGLE
ncbi:MAG: glycosyltransferase family 2 protein, partial [Planctomycetaceae bacterium]